MAGSVSSPHLQPTRSILVTGHTVAQNSPFSSLVVAVTDTGTYFPIHRGMARLSWPGWLG